MTKPRIPDADIIAAARRGATNAELAELVGMSVRNLDRDRRKRPDLNQGIKDARAARFEETRTPHGNRSRYSRGCRCTPCTYAQTMAHREWDLRRRETLGLPPPNPALGRRRRILVGNTTVVDARDRIAQAIARGHRASQIIAELGCTYDAYAAVRDELDEAAAS